MIKNGQHSFQWESGSIQSSLSPPPPQQAMGCTHLVRMNGLRGSLSPRECSKSGEGLERAEKLLEGPALPLPPHTTPPSGWRVSIPQVSSSVLLCSVFSSRETALPFYTAQWIFLDAPFGGLPKRKCPGPLWKGLRTRCAKEVSPGGDNLRDS